MIDSSSALVFTIISALDCNKDAKIGNVWLLNMQFLNIQSIGFHLASLDKNGFIAENIRRQFYDHA
jgi:hypothetical protein